MTWRRQIVYEANSFRHKHTLRGARATCLSRAQAWLTRCTDAPGPHKLELAAGLEPLGESLLGRLRDPASQVPPEHADFVRDALALLPSGKWEAERDGSVVWEGLRRKRHDPAAIPAGPTHAHLAHLVALLDRVE